MVQLAFVQVTVKDLDRALLLFAGRLGMRVVQKQEVAGSEIEELWGLRGGTTVRLAVLERAGHANWSGIRLVECRPTALRALRDGLPSYHPGPFGFAIGATDVERVVASLAEFGGEPLSAPKTFPGPPGRPEDATVEVVVRMPASYYVTILQVTMGQAGEPRADGLAVSGVLSASLVSRDAGRTHRFWHDALGLSVTPITEGVNDQWNVVRAIPCGTAVRTGSYQSPGAGGGRVYRAVIPGLSTVLEPVVPNVAAPGFCVAGFRTADAPSVLDRVMRAGHQVLARHRVSLAPWGETRVSTCLAPDGLIMEVAEA